MARWDIAMEPFFVRPMMSQWCPMSARPCRFPRRRPPNKGPGRASETGSTWKKPMALEKKNRFQDIDQIGFFWISTSNLFLGSPYTTYPFLHMSKWFGFDTIAQRCLTCQGRLDPDGISQVCSTQPDSSQNPFSEIFGSISLPRTSTAWSSLQKFLIRHLLQLVAELPLTPMPLDISRYFSANRWIRHWAADNWSGSLPESCALEGRVGCSTWMLSQPGKTHEVTVGILETVQDLSLGRKLPSSKFAAPVCTWCMFCRMVLGRNDCCFCRTGSIVRYEAGGSQWWDSQNWTTELALLGWGVKSWEVVIQSIGLKQPSCSTAWQLCWNELQKNRSATEVTLVFLTGINMP